MKIEIVDGPLDVGTPAKARYRTAQVDGAKLRVRVVDADSPSFGADFASAFRANVRRIRRENAALAIAAE